MRQVILALFILAGCATETYAQFAITHLNGAQVINGVTVTVGQSSPAPNSATLCSTGPYQIGKNYADWYSYSFSKSITHFYIKAIRFHDDDTMQVFVNGNPYNFTGGTPYNGDANCNLTTNNMVYPGNGMVTTSGGATGPGQGVELELSVAPSLINTVQVRHIRAATNNIASDIIYAAEYKDDSCALAFEAFATAPFCAGEDIQLSATLYPNTTYSWAAPTTAPTFIPSTNVREPLLQNVGVVNTGNYIVTGTRGVCEYKDTVNIPITTPPKIGNVVQAGPECVGAADTLSVPNVSIIGGDVYAWGPNGLQQFDPNTGYTIEFPSVQVSDRGLYYIWAEDIQGCVSDTVIHNFGVLSGVAAGFKYDIKEGCEADTVVFTNTSISHNTQTWDFGDNSPVSTESDPEHHYIVPKPNNASRTYTVQLTVKNGLCDDATTQDIELNHPIVANFSVDKEEICQGTTIDFENNSVVKPGTIPHFLWDLGEGDRKVIPNIQHSYQYDNSGTFNPELIVTDYLGCKESMTLSILVDSVGYISFTSDKESVCLGDEIIFTGDYYAPGSNSVSWDFGDGVTKDGDAKDHSHSYPETGTYTINYDVDYRICPDLNISKQITVKPYPEVYLGEDRSICPGSDPIFIGNIVSGNTTDDISYTWNTKEIGKGIYARSAGTYAVRAERDGCATTDSVVVRKDCYIDIPNAFTPNGDGTSDYFLPRQLLSKSVSSFNMQIYNRWGQQIFITDAVNGRGWDGRYNGEAQPVGVYVYSIQVTFGNGTTERYQGNVALLR